MLRPIYSSILWSTLLIVAPLTTDAQDVKAVELSSQSVFTICPLGRPYAYCGDAQTKVAVVAKADNTPKPGQNYYYITSGGRISGNGPQVIWDLSETLPGAHTITVGIGSDGVIKGSTVTKTIKVATCDICDLPIRCWCPEISIGPLNGVVKAGDAFVLHASTKNNDQKIPYQWDVSGGSIVEGKNAADVLIRTSSKDAGKTIVVVLNIETQPNCACENQKSIEVPIINR